jgi:S1-C subfamily serine protease
VENFLSGKESAKEINPIKPLSSELVRSIQELLTILGYETGEIDGVLGPLTISGIKAFEKTNKQDLTGRPSGQLLVSLQESIRQRNNQLATSIELPKELPIVLTGTGFFINKTHLVTNYHVVQKCNYLSIEKIGLLSIETQDQINDIAVLKSNEESNSFLKLYENPQLGQAIFTGGYPYNDVLDNFNFTIGNISSLRGTKSNISQFQFTAPVQPGSSGGPILSDRGGVVGVTVSGLGASFAEANNTLPQNIAFGVKVGVVKDILYEEDISFTGGQDLWFSASQEKIAQLAKNASVVVNCHSSL